MRRFLIYQHYYKLPDDERPSIVLNDENEYFKLSHQSIRLYAKKFGHHYHHIDKKHDISPFYAIFDPFVEGWCEDFDAVCWIDSDVLATVSAENVFDSLELNEIAGFMMNTHGRFRNAGVRKEGQWFRKHGHMNSGVVVFPRKKYGPIREMLSDLVQLHACTGRIEGLLGNYDQAIVNKMLRKFDGYEAMDRTFNYHLGRNDVEMRFEQSLIHYWRKFKPMLLNDFESEIILK